jgi:hypothetical protein
VSVLRALSTVHPPPPSSSKQGHHIVFALKNAIALAGRPLEQSEAKLATARGKLTGSLPTLPLGSYHSAVVSLDIYEDYGLTRLFLRINTGAEAEVVVWACACVCALLRPGYRRMGGPSDSESCAWALTLGGKGSALGGALAAGARAHFPSDNERLGMGLVRALGALAASQPMEERHWVALGDVLAARAVLPRLLPQHITMTGGSIPPPTQSAAALDALAEATAALGLSVWQHRRFGAGREADWRRPLLKSKLATSAEALWGNWRAQARQVHWAWQEGSETERGSLMSEVLSHQRLTNSPRYY